MNSCFAILVPALQGAIPKGNRKKKRRAVAAAAKAEDVSDSEKQEKVVHRSLERRCDLCICHYRVCAFIASVCYVNDMHMPWY
jgi:hypothetical protein